MEAVRAASVEAGDRPERNELIATATASVPLGRHNGGHIATVKRDRDFRLVFASIKNGCATISRDTEVATLVHQYPAVDNDQALTGSSSNFIVGWDVAAFRFCARGHCN
jgi:hypothetical protein